MGGVTLRVKKQNPVVDSDKYPECVLQFKLPGFGGVGDIICYGDCGTIEIGGREAGLQAVARGERFIIAPCGQSIELGVDR